MLSIFAGMIVIATPAETFGQRKRYARRVVRDGRVYYVPSKKPSFYRRHRNRVNLAIGTGAGAVVGGLIGGKKGALIGAGSGLGASALYTYVWNKKQRKYIRVRRR